MRPERCHGRASFSLRSFIHARVRSAVIIARYAFRTPTTSSTNRRAIARRRKISPKGSERLERKGSAQRGALLREVAGALGGAGASAHPPLAMPCDAEVRAGLRHPQLRGQVGEFWALAGPVLVRLFPSKGRAAGSRQEFRGDCGPGAAEVALAIAAAAKVLATRAPEAVLSEDNGPPVKLVAAPAPRLLVGRLAVRRVSGAADLRFHAGRALFAQSPEVIALCILKPEQLKRGLAILSGVLRGGRPDSPEVRVVQSAGVDLEALGRLHARVTKSLELGLLTAAAHHSINRAGLLACGTLAAALTALEAEQAPTLERVELLRFATSERFFQWWSKR